MFLSIYCFFQTALGRPCVTTLLALCTLNLSGCVSLPKWDTASARNWRHAIYYEYESWHSSVIVPAQLVAQHSRYFGPLAPKRLYLGFGYGDINFFTGRDTSLRSGAKALAFSDGPALQVLDYSQDPFAKTPSDRFVKLLISDAQLIDLMRYIDASAALDATGQPHSIANAEANSGYFFVAQGRYSMFSNCNTWAGEALTAAGLPISKTWGLTASGVYRQARDLAKIQQRLLRP